MICRKRIPEEYHRISTETERPQRISTTGATGSQPDHKNRLTQGKPPPVPSSDHLPGSPAASQEPRKETAGNLHQLPRITPETIRTARNHPRESRPETAKHLPLFLFSFLHVFRLFPGIISRFHPRKTPESDPRKPYILEYALDKLE